MVAVALDLLGGDGGPEVVADAVATVWAAEPVRGVDGLELVVVGPENFARDLLSARGIDCSRLRFADAGRAAGMSDDPLAMLRAHDDLTVSVACELVRRGEADAWVSVGHTGSAVAAAALGLGRLAGMSRPALAVILPALDGPVVLLDAGASTTATPDALVGYALAGWAYARVLGIAEPRVGLLSIGSEPGKGDDLRRDTHDLLCRALPAAGVAYAGPVEGHDVSLGTRADVVVTDGFTGNVLLKGVEGAVRWSARQMGAAYPDPEPARSIARASATSDFAGGMLLGVGGVTVVGHGAGSPDEVAACIRLAARASGLGLVAQTELALARVAAA